MLHGPFSNVTLSDLEGLVMDREVRALRDQFVTVNYSKVSVFNYPRTTSVS